jgi:hypothetical protein
MTEAWILDSGWEGEEKERENNAIFFLSMNYGHRVGRGRAREGKTMLFFSLHATTAFLQPDTSKCQNYIPASRHKQSHLERRVDQKASKLWNPTLMFFLFVDTHLIFLEHFMRRGKRGFRLCADWSSSDQFDLWHGKRKSYVIIMLFTLRGESTRKWVYCFMLGFSGGSLCMVVWYRWYTVWAVVLVRMNSWLWGLERTSLIWKGNEPTRHSQLHLKTLQVTNLWIV